ncbi:hypothetical protein MCHI_003103 [Candidatus Magnetoovum chiemensis]|nr:hypothetical protein MCHI_003103 [Candidatus Magnetoovum chiemensis]
MPKYDKIRDNISSSEDYENMQTTGIINEILNKVDSLSIEEQDFIANTISRRIHEKRRQEIAARAKEAEENYRIGNVTTGTVEDLMKSLSDDRDCLG